MKPDYLHGTPYTIEQPEGLFHFNSDTELLGKFLNVRKKDTILDIGTGPSAALLLYASLGNPVSLTGLEIHEQAAEQARKNLERNQVQGTIFHTSLQEYESNERYSLIFSNPPFFDTQKEALINANPAIGQARHEKSLSLSELFDGVVRLLSDNGRFCLVHRPDRLPLVLQQAERHGLYADRIRMVYTGVHGKARTVLYEFKRGKVRTCRIEEPAYLDQRETFERGGKK